MIDGFLYVIGGRGGPDTNKLDRYDPIEDEWQVLTPMPTARSGLAVAVFDGKLVVMGGEVDFANPPTRVFPQVEMYDPATDSWTSLDPMPIPRHGIGAATVDGLIYVPGGALIAGFDATDVHDVLRIE